MPSITSRSFRTDPVTRPNTIDGTMKKTKMRATTLRSIGLRSSIRSAFTAGSRNQPFSGRASSASPPSMTRTVTPASFRPRFSSGDSVFRPSSGSSRSFAARLGSNAPSLGSTILVVTNVPIAVIMKVLTSMKR